MERQYSPQTRERYDNLIAYPEGGLGYEEEVVSLDDFVWVMKWQAEAMAHNLKILKKEIPPSLQEALRWQDQDLANIQLRQRYTWGVIGTFLEEVGFDYLSDAYAATSENSPDASSPSE